MTFQYHVKITTIDETSIDHRDVKMMAWILQMKGDSIFVLGMFCDLNSVIFMNSWQFGWLSAINAEIMQTAQTHDQCCLTGDDHSCTEWPLQDSPSVGQHPKSTLNGYTHTGIEEIEIVSRAR